jgi:hypothetical protein
VRGDEGVPEFALDFLIAKIQAFRGSRAELLARRRTAGELHCRSQRDLDVTRRDLPVEMEGCYRSRFPSFPLSPVPSCSACAAAGSSALDDATWLPISRYFLWFGPCLSDGRGRNPSEKLIEGGGIDCMLPRQFWRLFSSFEPRCARWI